MSSGKQGQYPQNWSLSAPALLDVYMDARPNDRVRAFVLGRMIYDPTLPPNGTTSSGTGSASAGCGPGQRFADCDVRSGDARTECGTRPDVVALRSLAHGVRDRGQTARALGNRTLLDPDGLPAPAAAQSVAALRSPYWHDHAEAACTLGAARLEFLRLRSAREHRRHVDHWKYRGAARAEFVLDTLEVGVGAFGRQNNKAKFAGDFSFGVWDLDFYGEAAVAQRRRRGFRPLLRADQSTVDCTQTNQTSSTVNQLVGETTILATRGSGWKPQVTERCLVHSPVRGQGHLDRGRRVLLQRARLFKPQGLSRLASPASTSR